MLFLHLVTGFQTFFQAKFPSTFPLLKSLYINCSRAHCEDGGSIEKLLHCLPNLRVLHINAPICDLESCRIQGLTWAYKFPQLTHFALSILYQSAQDIAFLWQITQVYVISCSAPRVTNRSQFSLPSSLIWKPYHCRDGDETTTPKAPTHRKKSLT